MKFYKLIRNKVQQDRIIGNSTLRMYSSAPLLTETYLKISDDGLVWTAFGKPIPTSRHAHQAWQQLAVSPEEISELFVECEDPGQKVISNITFVVGRVDYEDFYDIDTFDNVEDATRFCQDQIDNDPGEFYEVRVEFDAAWEN